MKGPKQTELPQCGIVTAFDAATYRVKAHLPLLDTETDWIRVGSPYVGAGWGLRAPLHTGNEVVIIFPNGDLNNGIVVCALWSEECDPTAQAGDAFALMHESGSMLRFGTDGSVVIRASNIAMERL